MSRLIDADLLKENCKCTGKFEDNFCCVDLITLAKVIDEQPTAYDADKVVEQLEKEFKKYYGENWNKAPYLVKAIEIVKGGGVNG